MPPRKLITEDFRPLIADLVEDGLTNAEIQAELSTHHNLQCSLRSLTRARTDWGLQILPDEHTYDLVNDLISLYHGQGMRAEHIINIIKECHGFNLSPRTLARRCQVLGLHRKHDDIDLGKVTMEDVAEFIRQTKRNPDGKLAGYRRVHHILRNQHDVFVHRHIVETMVKQMDGDGVENRLRDSINRRTFYVPGPNHVWSADGHDKLKKFGITMYGFIDAWSRRVLGIFVHITNNNPAHIGLYFLETVKKIGGIPKRTVTDHGTETINLAAHQIELSALFANITEEEAALRHQYTDSTLNQKIECLWSQLMRQHNTALIDMIFTSMEQGEYNDNDPLERLLFLYLWVPLVQQSLDQWMYDYNSYSKRLDARTKLPTSCSPNYCYLAPNTNNGVEGLIPVTLEHVEEIQARHYPNADEIRTTSPLWLREICASAQGELQIDMANITMENIWTVFHKILSFLRSYDLFLLGIPEGVPRAATNHERAVETIQNRFGLVPRDH